MHQVVIVLKHRKITMFATKPLINSLKMHFILHLKTAYVYAKTQLTI